MANTEILIKATCLKLRDQVRVSREPWPYCTSTVVRINRDRQEVTLARPYIATSECEYAGERVLRYIGLEEYAVPFNTEVVWLASEGPTK